MMLFVGTPLYVLYLRALGARIGKNVTIFSPSIPVCTDLLTIGSGTVIRKGSTILGYRAHAGRIQTGPVTIGRDVYIGEATVLDINTSMGDGSQLGHSSALQSGEAVPAGERWHGSPAQPTQVNYIRVAPARCSTLRKTAFTLYILFMALFVYPPLGVAGFYILYRLIPILDKPTASAITSPELYIDALIVSLILFFGAIIIGFAVIFTIPRLLNLLIKPDKVYPLYGFHYMAHLSIAGMTNSKFFHQLFGDSSYIVHYLRCLGYKLPNVVQTGANFGTVMQHDTPYLSTIGSGTMVCDGLSMLHADYSGTSFRVSRILIGTDNFLGNGIAFPAGGRTGDNCLIGTKAMVPLDGEIREGIGLLGSPCFEIPRSVERDKQFDHLMTGDKQRKLLAAKNRYNLRTMGFFLFIQWLHSFILTVFVLATINLYIGFGLVTFIVALMLSLFFSTGYSILMERAVCRFRALKPQFCSIYDPYYWWHERLWKVTSGAAGAFSGTPFKNLMGRLLGVRIGRRVFDDGCNFTERTLVTIGDDCTINSSCEIQCHSLEDGIFKSDYTTLGAGCTLGVGVLVHYGVTMGDGSELAADSFLMKGEEIPPHARWGGNPARAITGRPASSMPQLVAHHSPLAGEEAQPDHLNGNAHQTEHNIAGVQVYQDSNGACRLVQQQQGAARRALKGGKIQWEN
jgi:non-ribosomal peptide synthetase-like protein